mgnify:CR=1|tara:strand:+ start:157 stop:348 length:192 start_codon:yes stop_codon:yes gene_type:complete
MVFIRGFLTALFVERLLWGAFYGALFVNRSWSKPLVGKRFVWRTFYKAHSLGLGDRSALIEAL